MPRTENKELYRQLENVKKTDSNIKQQDFYENIRGMKKSTTTDIPLPEKSTKAKSLRLLDSLRENGTAVQKTVKFTGTGLAAGLAMSLLFPPAGIALMMLSVITGITAIGAKVAHSYTHPKAEKSSDKKASEAGAIIEHINRQEKKDIRKDDVKQHTEISANTDRKSNVRKSAAGTGEPGLAMFTKPLNSLHPDIRKGASGSEPGMQQQEIQKANDRNIRMMRNRF